MNEQNIRKLRTSDSGDSTIDQDITDLKLRVEMLEHWQTKIIILVSLISLVVGLVVGLWLP